MLDKRALTVFLFVLSAIVPGIVRSEECHADSPIYIGTDNPRLPWAQDGSLLLKDVKWDKQFRTELIPKELHQEPLALRLFEITRTSGDDVLAGKPTGWLGAFFTPEKMLSTAGFGFNYGGDVRLIGSANVTSDGIHVYHTEEGEDLVPGDKEALKTAITARLKSRRILSLELTVPIYHVTKAGSEWSYSGENETLCLKSAKWVEKSSH